MVFVHRGPAAGTGSNMPQTIRIKKEPEEEMSLQMEKMLLRWKRK
jgi:hypothetical protein